MKNTTESKTYQDYETIILRSLGWARQRGYYGYSKFDALNSPVLRFLTGWSGFLRAAAVFGVSRMPINIRPVLGVRKKQNPKGLALFARSYFNMYKATNKAELLEEGIDLLDMLLGISQRQRFSGHCWGYDHPWQNIAFYIPPYEPNCVVTCAVAEAFLQGYEITGNEKFLEVVQSVADFILNDLTDINVGQGMRCCSYDLRSSWKVINVNSFAAALLAKLYRITNNKDYAQPSHEFMRWVLSQKTDYNAWYYTDPPNASRITHDNYHTGFVLDSIQEYIDVFDNGIPLGHTQQAEPSELSEQPNKTELSELAEQISQAKQAWRDGLVFYKDQLFTEDYAPKWMYNKVWPHDIHGAAQGIITFSNAAKIQPDNIQQAGKIASWALENMYNERVSRFYYQQGKYWTKRFTLMRWCQAWMCYALSVYAINNKN